jgi:hypothetical protein
VGDVFRGMVDLYCGRILMADRQHKNRDWMAGYQPTGVLRDPA